MDPTKNSPAFRKKFVSPTMNKRSSPVFWNRRVSPNSNKRSSSATQAIRPTASRTTKGKQTRWNKDLVESLKMVLVNRSTKDGFGWDSSTERMSADALTSVELLQTHPQYEKFRYKKVPYFEDLAIVVGDDEANGEDVATGIEADNDMEPIEEIGMSRTWNIGEASEQCHFSYSTDTLSTHPQEDVVTESRDKERSATKRKRRRGNNSSLDSLPEAAQRMANATERPNIVDLQTELK